MSVGVLLGVRIMPRSVGMRSKFIPGDSAVPQRTGRSQVFEGAAGPPRSDFSHLQLWPRGLGEGLWLGSVGVQASPYVQVWGFPIQGGGFLLGAVPGAAAPGRGLGDPQAPATGWGERIDPGVPFGPPFQPHPPGPGCCPSRAVLAPALPVAAEQPSSLCIPSPSACAGKREGCWGYCQRQSPPIPLQVPPYSSCLP